MSKLEDAIQIALSVHQGQLDKAGAPYILHPIRLMLRMVTEETRIVAILHDVLEDSPASDKWTTDRLRANGFAEDIIAAVNCVTRREGEAYDDFIGRVETNPIARQVKIADLEDNMNLARLSKLQKSDVERLARYHSCWKRLCISRSNS